MSESKLIWRGSFPGVRSLCVRTPSGPQFFVPGDEVPPDVVTPEYLAQLFELGRIERVAVEPPRPATRSIVPLIPETPPPSIQSVHPRSIAVQVGVMEAVVDAGPDGVFGTNDDVVAIAPRREITADAKPEPDRVPLDAKPDTAPVRKKRGKRRSDNKEK